MARRTQAEVRLDRFRSVAAVVAVAGLAFYLYCVFHAYEAGGLSVSSEIVMCAEAATGRFTTAYRVGEQLVVEHRLFPPSATCRWSGGAEAVLVPATWTWTGIVVVVLGLLGVVGATVARRRRRPPALASLAACFRVRSILCRSRVFGPAHRAQDRATRR